MGIMRLKSNVPKLQSNKQQDTNNNIMDKAIQKCKSIIAEVENDERFHYPPAQVFSNAPLALIQVELKARRRTAMAILAELEGEKS